MTGDIVLTSEAARICGVSADTIRLWARRGRLAARVTERGVRLFDRVEVERLARDQKRSTRSGTGLEQPLRGNRHAR